MKVFALLLASIGLTLPVAALAQEQAASELPEACQNDTLMPGNMGGMDYTGNMMENMGTQMSDATRAYMQAIAIMHPPMIQGAMAQDPDLAFNCSMIAHHQGAIAMARIQLQYGKDEEARKMAQDTIDEQSREVDEMTKWIEEHAKK